MSRWMSKAAELNRQHQPVHDIVRNVSRTSELPFRFDALNHEYLSVATGEVFPHITGMLEQTGWIDDRWYTEESSDRGMVRAARLLPGLYHRVGQRKLYI